MRLTIAYGDDKVSSVEVSPANLHAVLPHLLLDAGPCC